MFTTCFVALSASIGYTNSLVVAPDEGIHFTCESTWAFGDHYGWVFFYITFSFVQQTILFSTQKTAIIWCLLSNTIGLSSPNLRLKLFVLTRFRFFVFWHYNFRFLVDTNFTDLLVVFVISWKRLARIGTGTLNLECKKNTKKTNHPTHCLCDVVIIILVFQPEAFLWSLITCYFSWWQSFIVIVCLFTAWILNFYAYRVVREEKALGRFGNNRTRMSSERRKIRLVFCGRLESFEDFWDFNRRRNI